MNLKNQLKSMVEKKVRDRVKMRERKIHEFVMTVLREEYTTSILMAQWGEISKRLGSDQLANPVEIISNSLIVGDELRINLRDERVSRTFRALELYGGAPFQKVKDRLRVLGRFTLKTIK